MLRHLTPTMMSTLLIPSPAGSRAPLAEDWPSGIVVATDGRAPSDAALVAAHMLAGSSTFGAVSVVSTDYSTDRQDHWAAVPPSMDSQRDRVEEQLRRVIGESADVWIELAAGYPPAVLASFAEERDVSLLVVGIGRPRVLDRLLGDESTLRLARMIRTPMFAVAADRAVPPQRIVVGTDFSATSARAARLALAVGGPAAEVLLVHVKAPGGRPIHAGALRRQADMLQTGFCGRVTPIDLTGDPATELLAFANARGADAIALGAHGHGTVMGGAMGPVATRVVRCSSCSLLVAPDAR